MRTPTNPKKPINKQLQPHLTENIHTTQTRRSRDIPTPIHTDENKATQQHEPLVDRMVYRTIPNSDISHDRNQAKARARDTARWPRQITWPRLRAQLKPLKTRQQTKPQQKTEKSRDKTYKNPVGIKMDTVPRNERSDNYLLKLYFPNTLKREFLIQDLRYKENG